MKIYRDLTENNWARFCMKSLYTYPYMIHRRLFIQQWRRVMERFTPRKCVFLPVYVKIYMSTHNLLLCFFLPLFRVDLKTLFVFCFFGFEFRSQSIEELSITRGVLETRRETNLTGTTKEKAIDTDLSLHQN